MKGSGQSWVGDFALPGAGGAGDGGAVVEEKCVGRGVGRAEAGAELCDFGRFGVFGGDAGGCVRLARVPVIEGVLAAVDGEVVAEEQPCAIRLAGGAEEGAVFLGGELGGEGEVAIGRGDA